jgi:hypothetical protein
VPRVLSGTRKMTMKSCLSGSSRASTVKGVLTIDARRSGQLSTQAIRTPAYVRR